MNRNTLCNRKSLSCRAYTNTYTTHALFSLSQQFSINKPSNFKSVLYIFCLRFIDDAHAIRGSDDFVSLNFILGYFHVFVGKKKKRSTAACESDGSTIKSLIAWCPK